MKQQSVLLSNHTVRACATIKLGLQTRIAYLEREREQLEEEVRQLRAAIQIYAEIARRREAAADARDSKDVPLWAA
jgi:cell division protein FtsB